MAALKKRHNARVSSMRFVATWPETRETMKMVSSMNEFEIQGNGCSDAEMAALLERFAHRATIH